MRSKNKAGPPSGRQVVSRAFNGECVTTDFALQLFGELLLTALFISAPVLIPVMIVGLVISLVQVVTQVQEISLTFVPKIITVFIAVVVFGPWMLRKLLAFASAAIANAGMM